MTEPYDISAVWKDYFRLRSNNFRNLLIEHYLRLVKYSSDRLWEKLPDEVNLDDLIQAGIFGLKDAIETYNPESDVRFETYCMPRIRSTMLDKLRSMDWIPKLIRAKAHRLKLANQTLRARLGRMPTDKELAEELELDETELHRLQRDANTIGLILPNNKSNENEGEKDIGEIDITQDIKSTNPIAEAQKRKLKKLISKGLTRAEKLIIIFYYCEEMTFKEIGKVLKIPENKVSEMHSSVVARLKAAM